MYNSFHSFKYAYNFNNNVNIKCKHIYDTFMSKENKNVLRLRLMKAIFSFEKLDTILGVRS